MFFIDWAITDYFLKLTLFTLAMTQLQSIHADLQQLNTLLSLLKGLLYRQELITAQKELSQAEQKAAQLVDSLKLRFKRSGKVQGQDKITLQLYVRNFDKINSSLLSVLSEIKSAQQIQQAQLRRQSQLRRSTVNRRSRRNTQQNSWVQNQIQLIEVNPEVDLNVMLLQQKNRELEKTANLMDQILGVEKQIKLMLDQQGQQLDVAEKNLISGFQNTKNAVQQLEEAREQQKKAKKKKICCALIIVLVLAIIIVPIAVKFS